MRSDHTLCAHMERGEIRPALEAVRISSELIALYPHPLQQPQPYVILLDTVTGIRKCLDLKES